MDQPDRLSRRHLLTLAAAGAGALVLGLDQVARAEDGWEQGAWDAALRAMQATGRHGVVVLLPPDAEGRRRVVDQLARRIPIVQEMGGPFDPLAAWFVESVWVCAPRERVDARPGETLVLVDPKGKRVAGATVAFGDAADFARGVEALLTGEGRLEQRAAAASAEVKAVLANLARMPHHDESAPPPVEWLCEHFEEAGSAVLQAWRRVDDGDKERLAWIVRQACERRAAAATGMPFGVKWKVDVTVPEPCPPCGMARSTVDGRTFLEFWGK